MTVWDVATGVALAELIPVALIAVVGLGLVVALGQMAYRLGARARRGER